MKLTRLRLHGFKSFVEPTDFMIEPGLTGVVGPNGCGKSNLVEALRWAMGETSHKSLRAADMDAVIFAGSGNRPARNHAEVVMTIDNSDRSAPAAVNDSQILEISRRIEREAGSVYRINGRDVRARDVQLLFADAATGARSPALVHQGKIGEIIQAKPEQRRRVLEDAAGVAGLHARRHEAELRLRAAETNLTRVEDVIGQLAGQMEGLKRQARQAIRYREVAAKVRKAEAMLFHLRWVGANADVAEAGHTHDIAVREMAERTREQAEAARIQAERAAELPALREAEARAAAGLQRLTNAREQLDREEQRAKERVAELDRRLTQFAADIGREQQQIADSLEQAKADFEKELENDRQLARERTRQGFLIFSVIVVVIVAGALLGRLRYTSRAKDAIEIEKQRSDDLLLNILPEEVAAELKEKGRADARAFETATVLFTDFKGFTSMSELLSPAELVAEIDHCFKGLDAIVEKHRIEKIKTIGDAYMAAAGLPDPTGSTAADIVLAALEMRDLIARRGAERTREGKPAFEMRIGLHSGPVIAGIVGVKKFAYDIWGDTVNTAARMESSGEPGKVNISATTYELVKHLAWLRFEPRGLVHAKGKGDLEMYFVERA